MYLENDCIVFFASSLGEVEWGLGGTPTQQAARTQKASISKEKRAHEPT